MGALAAKGKAETKRKVDLELGPTLKEKIVKKYQAGTMSEAEAFLKEHKEEEYREQMKLTMKSKVDQLVQSKLAGARQKLKGDLIEKLKKSLFEDAKAAAADKLKEDTEGMSDANAKAVELSRDKEASASCNRCRDTGFTRAAGWPREAIRGSPEDGRDCPVHETVGEGCREENTGGSQGHL